MHDQVALLIERGLVAGYEVTASGDDVVARLLAARRESLHALVADWSPGEDPRLNDAIARLARELAGETPATA